MAELSAVRCTEQEHGNAVPEARLERRVRIDVDLRDAGAGRCGKRDERCAHVVAQMAVRPDEERELGHAVSRNRYSPFPSFSVV